MMCRNCPEVGDSEGDKESCSSRFKECTKVFGIWREFSKQSLLVQSVVFRRTPNLAKTLDVRHVIHSDILKIKQN